MIAMEASAAMMVNGYSSHGSHFSQGTHGSHGSFESHGSHGSHGSFGSPTYVSYDSHGTEAITWYCSNQRMKNAAKESSARTTRLRVVKIHP